MPSGEYDVGRGQTAVADMKRRIQALREAGADLTAVIDSLWERSRQAELGGGYLYDYAAVKEDRDAASTLS